MTQRGMSAAVLAENAKKAVQFGHLVSVEFDSGTIYLTDFYRTITWGGHDYLGVGHFGGFEKISEGAELQVRSLKLFLTGVSQEHISEVLQHNYIHRPVNIYRVWFNVETDQLIADPVLIFLGRTEQATVEDDPDAGTSTVVITAAGEWSAFDTIAGWHTNDAEHQLRYPGDLGFEFASEYNKEVKWGRS